MSIADKLETLEGIISNAVEGKELIAAALTQKGIETASNASFAVMAQNVSAIASSENEETIGLTEEQWVDLISNRSNFNISELPSGITKLAPNAFYGCTSLSISELPNTVTTIAMNSFSGCTSLNISEIPSNVASISTNSFSGCLGLTSITFKGTPNIIYSNSFNGCSNLTNIYVPWDEGAVANAPWGAANATIHYNWTDGEQ